MPLLTFKAQIHATPEVGAILERASPKGCPRIHPG